MLAVAFPTTLNLQGALVAPLFWRARIVVLLDRGLWGLITNQSGICLLLLLALLLWALLLLEADLLNLLRFLLSLTNRAAISHFT